MKDNELRELRDLSRFENEKFKKEMFDLTYNVELIKQSQSELLELMKRNVKSDLIS